MVLMARLLGREGVTVDRFAWILLTHLSLSLVGWKCFLLGFFLKLRDKAQGRSRSRGPRLVYFGMGLWMVAGLAPCLLLPLFKAVNVALTILIPNFFVLWCCKRYQSRVPPDQAGPTAPTERNAA